MRWLAVLTSNLLVTLAFGQTVEVELDGVNGYTLTIRNIDLALDVASVTMELVGGGDFDTLNNASTSPPLGGNNDPQDEPIVTVTPNAAPLSPGENWSGNGDIDGNVNAVNATVTLADGRTLSGPLSNQGGNVYSAIFMDASPGAPPGGSDFADICAGTDLATGGCLFFPVSTLYTYTGDQKTLVWAPDASDVFREDRMLYRLEVRAVPSDILVDSRQTMPAETTFLWTPATVGFYKALVMACDPELIEGPDPDTPGPITDLDPAEHCSDWADSTNDVNTPADFPGWMVYAAIRPPSGGGIE